MVLSEPLWVSSFNQLVGTESNEDWLRLVILETPCVHLRQQVCSMIERLCLETTSEDNNASQVWIEYLLKLFPLITSPVSVGQYASRSLHYFHTLSSLIKLRSKYGPNGDIPFMATIFEAMKNHPHLEVSSSSSTDETIVGLLELSRVLIQSHPELRNSYGESLIDEVFHRNLFDIPTVNDESKIPPPRCKTPQSRSSALQLLLELVNNCPELMNRLCLKTLELYESQSFSSHWDYLPAATEKSSCSLTGLCNLGATCYMNSLMQQLHMNPHLRHRVYLVEDKEEDKEHSVLYQLQSIFSHLQESVMKYYDPTPFCNIYKIYGDEVMNPGVQMDVDEFFANIMDRLETLFKGSSQEKALTELFGGEVVNQIIPQECPHVVERTEPFLNLSLEVKNKFQLDQCLDLYIQGDMLEGDNKFHCSVCDNKVTALKRCCINKLPHFLMIHLKRFDFDLELLRRSKVNQYCAFPEQLNLEPYTKEGLARRENREGNQDLPQHPESFYEFTLTGVLVHQGTTESGHYYSFIKDRESGQWYKFNDSHVTPFDFKNLADECFGGTHQVDVFDHTQRKWVTRSQVRSNNAYMLFYERTHPEIQLPPVTREHLRQAVPRQLYDDIWKENVTFLRDKCLFDKGFREFSTQVRNPLNALRLHNT